MLMKYKDIKSLSMKEMKEIKGGYAPQSEYCQPNQCNSDSDCNSGYECKSVTCEDNGSYKRCKSIS